MDIPLTRRALHFFKKAGPRAFLRKSWLRLRRGLPQGDQTALQQAEARLYQEKLKSLPVEDGHVTVPVLDFQMKLRAADQGLSRQLILHGIREQDAIDYLRPLLPKFRTILEIGANQGYYAIFEALNTPPDAKIYAFEPHPENVRTLKLNTALNKCPDKFPEIFQGAVSDRNGTADLQVHELSNWHSLSRVNLEGGWQSSIKVPTISLDEFCRTRGISAVDFVRMDVEGHEAEIVEGGRDILQKSPTCVLFIEIHTGLLREAGHQPEKLLQTLESLGFKTLALCGNGKQFRTSDWGSLIRNLELLLEQYGNHMFLAK